VKREAKEMEMWVFVQLEKRHMHRAEWMKIERERKKAKNSFLSGQRLFVLCY